MRVTYLGHTAALIETRGKRILVDPWLTDPAYVNSWWHWPPVNLRPEELGRIDLLYVSHPHPDHFDPKTLARLDSATPVVLGKFPRQPLKEKLESIGFRDIRLVPFWEPREIFPGVKLLMTPSQHSVWDTNDTSMAVWTEEGTLYDGNDCVLHEAFAKRLKEAVPRIDLAMMPFTPNFHYPLCFDSLSDAEKKVELVRMKEKDLSRLLGHVKLLDPAAVMPFGSPFVLPADEETAISAGRPTTLPSEAVKYLDDHGVKAKTFFMYPGDRYDFREGLRRHGSTDYFDDYDGKIRAYRAEKADELKRLRRHELLAGADFPDVVKAYFQLKLKHARKLGLKDRLALVFPDRGGETVLWNFGEGTVEFLKTCPDAYDMGIRIPSHLLGMVCRGVAHWDDILFSFRCRFIQRVYSASLWGLLRNEEPELLRDWRAWELEKTQGGARA